MSPIEFCSGPKAPAGAVVEAGGEIKAVLPGGRQVILYSTTEGFETEPAIKTAVKGKVVFREGDILPLQGGLVARAVRGEEENGAPRIEITEKVLILRKKPLPKLK